MAIMRVDNKSSKHVEREGRCSIKYYVIVLTTATKSYTVELKAASAIEILEIEPGVNITLPAYYEGTPDFYVSGVHTASHAFRRVHAFFKKNPQKRLGKFSLKMYRLGSKKCPVAFVGGLPKYSQGAIPKSKFIVTKK